MQSQRAVFSLAEVYAVRREFTHQGKKYTRNSRFPARELGVNDRRLRQMYEAGYLRFWTSDDAVNEIKAKEEAAKAPIEPPQEENQPVDPTDEAPIEPPQEENQPVDPTDEAPPATSPAPEAKEKTKASVAKSGKNYVFVRWGEGESKRVHKDDLAEFLDENNLEVQEDDES